MTREAWYAHKMQDHIDALTEYIDILRDGAVDTKLTGLELDMLRSYLYTIDHELDVRIEDLTN